MPSNFTNNTFSSSSSIEVDPSIPFISTGSSSDTRQRSRSLSVDYITQSNSVIKRKSSTVITVFYIIFFLIYRICQLHVFKIPFLY